MASNFDFVSQEPAWEHIAERAKKAEQGLAVAPEVAAIFGRSAMELSIKWVYDNGENMTGEICADMGAVKCMLNIAAKNPDSDELKYEICDFLYHMMVLMAERGLTWKEITDELAERH